MDRIVAHEIEIRYKTSFRMMNLKLTEANIRMRLFH